jgi:SAM-dependent methyltransferase
MNKMALDQLRSSQCAICKTQGNSVELYPSNFNLDSFNAKVFSARRLPDRIHYRIVKCNHCGLVRSDPTIDTAVLKKIYAKSNYGYEGEESNLKITYGRYLSKFNRYAVKKDSLLEIGCGEGIFLQEALAQGYACVCGVEPSKALVSKAKNSVQAHIVCDMMRPHLFNAEQFDAICMFQVLDHVDDPQVLLFECFRLLKPGGLLLCINHNIESMSARILKRYSPIIDIEHTFFYSSDTMRRIFLSCGFEIREEGRVFNHYSLRYLVWLSPIFWVLKRSLLNLFKNAHMATLKFLVPLGNMYLIVQKPIAK